MLTLALATVVTVQKPLHTTIYNFYTSKHCYYARLHFTLKGDTSVKRASIATPPDGFGGLKEFAVSPRGSEGGSISSRRNAVASVEA